MRLLFFSSSDEIPTYATATAIAMMMIATTLSLERSPITFVGKNFKITWSNDVASSS